MPTARLTRATAATVAVLTGLLLLATPAAAHVRVDGGSARQGDRDATLTFDAAAESTVAGIAALRVTVPAGISGTDVTLVSGPPGWTLRSVAGGFEVGGPAVPTGEDVRYVVTVAKLPTGRPRLAFPTDQRYEDGRVDHWTTVSEHPAGHTAAAAGHPAPILELAERSSQDATSTGDGGAAGAADGGGAPAHGAGGDPTAKEDTAVVAQPPAPAEPARSPSLPLIALTTATLLATATALWSRHRRRTPTPASPVDHDVIAAPEAPWGNNVMINRGSAGGGFGGG